MSVTHQAAQLKINPDQAILRLHTLFNIPVEVIDKKLG